jgi:hypothetical protein
VPDAKRRWLPGAVASLCLSAMAFPAVAVEFSPEAISGAEALLKRYESSGEQLSLLDKSEVAKRLNYLTFRHCTTGEPRTGLSDINELFRECRTTCGGYAYVLRTLLHVAGVTTRYFNLYNLPQQGNHTLVEVEIGKETWALFDPTFGAYFSAGGVSGKPMGGDQLRYSYPASALKDVVVGVAPMSGAAFDSPLEALYAPGAFKFEFMDLANYARAEKAFAVNQNVLMPLVMTLDATSLQAGLEAAPIVAGVTGATSVAEGEAGFLAWSNASLNDAEPDNDTSFLWSFSGMYWDNSYGDYFESLNTIRIRGMAPKSRYVIRVCGLNNTQKTQYLQFVSVGRDAIVRKTAAQTARTGRFCVSNGIYAQSDTATIALSLRRKNARENIRLFGVELSRQKTPTKTN